MRRVKMLLFLLVASLCAGRAAFADRHYHRGWHPHGSYHGYYRAPAFGFYFGGPWYSRPYYPYPYYSYPYPYYPPVVTVPSRPPVYIERDPPQTTQQLPPGYWYYCDNPQGYYPYVRECPQGWRQVEPTPQR